MPSVNPGPATNGFANSLNSLIPVNTQQSSDPVFKDGIRLLGVAKAVSLNAAGDPVIMNIVNSSSWVPATVITANGLISGATGDIHLGTVGLYTAAAGGGTAVLTTAALTGQTVSTFAYVRASTTTSTTFTQKQLYVNVGTAVANGTTDVYLYGYDLS